MVRLIWPVRDTYKEQWAIFKVEGAEVLPVDAPMPPPLPNGIVVTDDKLGLTFTVSSRDIIYQGRTLKLTEPLLAHPGDKLEEMLRTAVSR